jgi:lambda repressor-like predicted transcriptional regulator
MPYRQPPNRGDDLSRLRPPTVTEAEKPLRRAVAMAYRTGREAGRSHHDALDAAEAVYFQAHPDALANRLAASARVNGLIASAINVHPKWFWRNVRARYEAP